MRARVAQLSGRFVVARGGSVKFLCDRCKTRYSIGDERVRGKILKIRCKNCANVITVREGMTADEPDRRLRPTTAAPMAAASAPAGSALASAFVAQMTTPSKPPPALEEEWYVSIDGEQSGPFSLAEAQRWIAAKPFDAELHCWSEGFDDWLPVDKVSHFRGLRKKPPAPPALPRFAQRPPPTPSLDESEPKPLFAATMATLERSATQPPPVGAPMGLPAATSVPTLKSPTGGPNGVVTKANGTGAATSLPRSTPVPRLNDSAQVAKLPSAIGTKPGSGPNRPGTQQGVGQSAGAKALASAFDTGDGAGESMTTVDSPAFKDEIATSAEPVAAKRAFDRIDAVTDPPANGRGDAVPDISEDELAIGEVSRVVKLADLMNSGPAQRKVSRPPLGRSTQSALALRATGSTPKIDPSQLADAAMQQPMGDAAIAEGLVAAPVVAQAHRRGMIMLIGVAAVLLIGVAVAVVLIIQGSGGDDTGGGLGHIKEYDNSRPEEVVRAHMLPQEGPGATTGPNVTHNRPHITTQHPNGSAADETPGTGTKIKSDEVEDMANKNSGGTQRCYMRAQRGAAGIEIADLKRLSVTLTIDKSGTVSDVQFAEKTSDQLLTCLRTQIKLWKFRESPGGLYRIVLAFGGS
jgi:predicted Zn finger-like uncharacterized protein